MLERIRKYYEKGLYTREMVHKFVEKGVITEEEYEQITRKD